MLSSNMMRTSSLGARGELGSDSNSLQSIIRNKQRMLESQLSSMQPNVLKARLTSFPPPPSPNSLLRLILDRSFRREITVIAEVSRSSPSDPPQLLASRCKNYLEWGADAIAVRTDEETSPDGLADLATVCGSLNVPVIRTDWILHPLQVAETREAGAAALTTVHAILEKGLSGLSNYALSLGLDPIVEIVNLKDLEATADLGIILFGINLSVGLSLRVPGIRQDVAKSLIGGMPFGVYTIVGIKSEEEALEMKIAGADALYLRREVWQGLTSKKTEQDDEMILKRIRDMLSND